MQENLKAFIYIKISKIPVESPKKLPVCHCIGKRLKYPRVSRKITKMPLVALVAHGRLLLAAARFSGAISVQPMVDPSRYDVEDSDGGGIDDR